MGIKTVFACVVALLIILPVFGRSIHENNIDDYDSFVENNIEKTLPEGISLKDYNKIVRSYWTPERRASAKPMGLLMLDNNSSLLTRSSSRRRVDDGRPRIRAAVPGVRPKNLKAVPSVIGKVYFTLDKGNYVCSGSVVKGENKDTLITAGHCVFDPDTQQWASAFYFVPEYFRGEAPYGEWVARNIVALRGWTDSSDFNYDVAIVLVSESEKGEHVQDLTGALGMTNNWDREAYSDSYGYPVNLKRGEELSTCFGLAEPAQVSGYDGMELVCDMTGGSSGGPWVQEEDYQTSVNSFGLTSRPNVMFGPLFNDAIYTMWEKYQSE